MNSGKDISSKIKDESGPTGRWTQKEHERFLEAYKLYGKNWRLVQRHIGSRSVTQTRSHAQKYLAKLERIKNCDNSGTQDLTPMNSPVCGPVHDESIKENHQLTNGKRKLSSEEIEDIKPKKKISDKYQVKTKSIQNNDNKVENETPEKDIIDYTCYKPAYFQIQALMSIDYGIDYYMCIKTAKKC